MERTIYIILALLLYRSVLGAQTAGQQIIYEAFKKGDMLQWKHAIDDMELSEVKSNDFLLELINYQIGYVGYCIGKGKKQEAHQYLLQSQKNLKRLRQKNYKPSYIHSYQGSIDGLRIGLNIIIAPFVGPGIIKNAKLAIELNPHNPYGYILYANSRYYMWAMFGGSKDIAMTYYKKAEQIMEQNSKFVQSWNYLSLLTMMAHAYEEMEQYTLAHAYYKKILRIEPDYSWVKNELYPHFLKKLNHAN